jgi:hypothetical protein
LKFVQIFQFSFEIVPIFFFKNLSKTLTNKTKKELRIAIVRILIYGLEFIQKSTFSFPRIILIYNNPLGIGVVVGRQLQHLPGSEPRVIVRPACPPGELLGQRYSNVRVDVPRALSDRSRRIVYALLGSS